MNSKLEKFNKRLFNSKIAIVGLGVSNIPLLDYLYELGCKDVVIFNDKEISIDISKYGLDMLKAGTDIDKYTEDELIRLDAKCIEKEENKYVIAQENTVSIPDVLKRKAKIEEEMNKEILAKGLSLFVFVITDIVNSNSEAIVLGDRTELISKSYEIDDDIAVMPGVVSRKKQILPLIEKNM